MRLNVVNWFLSIFLLFIYYPLIAQRQELTTIPVNSRFIDEIGLTVGLGTSTWDLRDFNKHLEVLQIGRIDNDFASRTLSVYLSGRSNLKASLDVNVGSSFESSTIKSDAYLLLENSSYGLTLYKALLHTNRFELLLLGGFRFTNIDFEYNVNTNSSSSFDSLVSNPSGNASMVHLTSDANQDLNLGGRFQYRLGKKENIKPREYRIGFDSGYIYNFKSSPWGQVGSSLPTPAMPKIRSDSFYFHLTFSGYFKI